MDIQKFQQKLTEVCELGEKNGKVLKPEQIKECFGELDLDKSQLIKILQYLKLKGISIEGAEEISATSQTGPEEVSEEKEEKVPLTAEEEAYLKEYLEGLEEQEQGERSAEELFELLSKGDALAQAELSQKYLHAAAEMAVEMNCEEIFIADLIQEANISLLMALGEEEPEEKDEILSIEVPDVIGLDKKNAHEVFKDSLYKKLSEKTGKKLPWGYLTGVRPSKIAYTMLEEGATKEQIKKHFMDKHYASEEKAELALTVARKELDILTDMDYKTGYSLYIGIPFCPSICLYCSFSSYALGAYKDYVDNYVDALIKEIRFVAESMKGRRLDTVYMGGGTPTTLSAAQLDKVLTVVEEAFDLSRCRELTVEAGRPDSVTPDKFKVLKAHNVGRISINPQTMNQKTLDLIGRKHTVEDIKNAYAMAREAGLDNINMDMILGLPGEGVDEVYHTLNEIKAMRPESLTVHSLAIKRASRLNILRQQYTELSIKNTDSIIAMTEQTARDLNMQPYYMYRQKNMAGNFENVGYAVPGLECIYNILIMEEKQTIIACGAGASTKVVFHNESDDNHSVRIERIENVKDVRSYIERIDEMIERKRKFFGENEF